MGTGLNLRKFSFLLLTGILSSCIDSPVYEEEKAVIDGWIDSDGYPTVIFTSSIVPGEDTDIADKVIRWGKVTISDGTSTIVMTGGPDKELFPPYKYITYQMKGEPGKKYTITAHYRDLHAEAECEMPMPVAIEQVLINPIEGSDSLRAGELRFITPSNVPAYFYITMRDYDEGGRFYPSMLGTYKATEPLKEVTLPLFHAKNQLSEEDFVPQLKIGEKLEINLCTITEEVYEFWSAYDNAVLFGGSQFIDSSQSITGNVRGGYGIWSAQGVSTVVVEVK